MKTFAQFLVEKEKLFTAVTYGTGKKGQTPGKAMASAIRPANPSKMAYPFQGLHFPHIYGRDDPRLPSGVIGKK